MLHARVRGAASLTGAGDEPLPVGYGRRQRVSELIRRDLAQILRDLNDPRITGLITVSSVELSRDMSWARVYYSVLGAQADAELDAGLKAAAGYMRRRLGQSLTMKRLPALRFVRVPEGRVMPEPQDLPDVEPDAPADPDAEPGA